MIFANYILKKAVSEYDTLQQRLRDGSDGRRQRYRHADVMISSFRTRPGRSSVGVVSSLGRSL